MDCVETIIKLYRLLHTPVFLSLIIIVSLLQKLNGSVRDASMIDLVSVDQ